MTTLTYRFKINGVEVEEPTNWDSVEININRSETYHGLENIFSSAMIFWNSGAQEIRAIYDQYGVDGECNLLIEYNCGDSYTTLFNGILNLSTYSYSEGEVKVNFEDKSIQRLFKNRMDTPISLADNVGLDGQSLTPLSPFNLGLHSKNIIKYSQWTKPDSSVNPFEYPDYDYISGSGFKFITLSSQAVVEEIETTYSPADGTILPSSSESSSLFISDEQGNYNIDINTSFEFRTFAGVSPVESEPVSLQWSLILQIRNPDNSVKTSFTLKTGSQDWAVFAYNSIIVNYNGVTNSSILAGERVVLYFAFFFETASSTQVFLSNTTMFYSIEDIKILSNTISLPSQTRAYLVYEALNRVLESISGQNDILRSQIFGRTNSSPTAYPANGIESWAAITNGLNIRNMLDGDGNPLPIVCKFNDFFNSTDALFNLGCQVVKDGNLFRIVVEGKEYFYDKNTVIFQALNVDGLVRTVANDRYFSNIQLGSEKWNLNQGQSNGRDEFNAVNNWYQPLKTIMNSFQKLSKYITSGYVLEYTRRVQFKSNPTTEYETDNDNFIIATNRSSVSSNKYSPDGSTQVYPAGTVSERDENFTVVNNVLNPDTCYNLRFSPFRRFCYWWKFIAPGLWKTPTSDIKFQSGEANYLMQTQLNSTLIDSTSGLHQENEPINYLSPNQGAYPPYNIAQKDILFIPEYIEFKYPVPFSDILTILANTRGVVEYSCNDGSIERGFVISIGLTPNEAGSECSFKLIRAAV